MPRGLLSIFTDSLKQMGGMKIDFRSYIIPELVVLIPVLFALGWAIKKSKIILPKRIPLALIGIGIVLAVIWSVASNGFMLMSVWVGITQGVLCAGGAVLTHQLIKQGSKKE